MKGILYLILAVVLVLVVWGLIKALLAVALILAFKVALIVLFCFLVYTVYKALMGKEKNMA